MTETFESHSPEATFEFGNKLGQTLKGGDIILLYGGLGAGKTLLTKGILSALDFDIDEVTSPSFTLVNVYKTPKFNVHHIDLWRISDDSDAAFAVGLDEIVDDEISVTIIEWAEKLGGYKLPGRMITVELSGDGDEPRMIVYNRSA
ncbi:MAG: tRNA (adenosine(37)-N6)-threonylcarbamoyltransferase complex ATPase subunit type 1 TsaE [Blastocatellia bacterium]|nr:tRNA (adenosine(37)-N6)-threonylcarbamoyltransferase complex ATPase subunit type 1 TsaE [Blastocatellia bacterium]